MKMIPEICIKNTGEIQDEICLFTKDTFKCGICQAEKFSIDDYVAHMLKEENCILVLESSRCIKDLLLPKFKKNCTQLSEDSGSKKELPFNSDIMIEIEVGQGIRRWKCKICCLTFSRQAALINHFKLAKHPLPKNETYKEKEKSIPKDIKKELKESNQALENSKSINYPVEQQEDIKKALKSAEPTCCICGQIFKSDAIVDSHLKIVHSEKRPFECSAEGCDLSFKTKGSLVRHMRRHSGARPYKCVLCNRAYRESGSLLRHQQSKVPCNKKPNKHLPRYGLTLPFTPACKLDNEAECKVPLKKERIEEGEEEGASNPEVGQQETEDTKVRVRKEIFNTNQESIEENVTSGSLDKKPVINLKDLKKELSHFESEESKEFSELEDRKGFGDLEEQIVRRSFTCPICYKVYTKMAFLSTHMKTHLAELGNECSTCHKRFSSDHTLSRHLLSHSSARQFECRQCGKAFKLRSHVLEHFKSHTTNKSVPCSECGRLFKSVSSRNNHLKIHAGERNFECSLCFKKFLVKASFIRHLRVHTTDRPFQCPHCKQGFKEHGTLNRHIKFKRSCAQFTASSVKGKCEEPDRNIPAKDFSGRESRTETLSEINDTFSDADSELESFLSENFDLSSIYSEHSDIAFSPKDYLIPSHLDNLETLPPVAIKQEVKKELR